jgi:putative lipoic acid-binding regulatory protein
MSDSTPADVQESLIEFPCHFPIKVMGKNVPEFSQVICDLLLEMNPSFNPADVDMRPSSTGKYISLTCKVWVENKVQLDDIYRALSGHDLVSVVL